MDVWAILYSFVQADLTAYEAIKHSEKLPTLSENNLETFKGG